MGTNDKHDDTRSPARSPIGRILRSSACSDVIPAELGDTPIIFMTGSREMTVDGFHGIIDYTENELTFGAGAGTITVTGFDLAIRYMSLHTIVVGGDIKNVEFGKRS